MSDNEIDRIMKVYEYYRLEERNIRWSLENLGNAMIYHERQRVIRELLARMGFFPLDKRMILEIGCGEGSVLGSLQHWGANPENMFGVDLLPIRIECAKKNFPNIHFECANAENLNFPDGQFDLVVFFTVFSSILDESMKNNIASEAIRLLKPYGAILWYDFRYNNPDNPHVRGIKIHDISRLFPSFTFYLRSITLLPPLARRLGRMTRILYPILSSVPILRTHYAGIFIKGC